MLRGRGRSPTALPPPNSNSKSRATMFLNGSESNIPALGQTAQPLHDGMVNAFDQPAIFERDRDQVLQRVVGPFRIRMSDAGHVDFISSKAHVRAQPDPLGHCLLSALGSRPMPIQ